METKPLPPTLTTVPWIKHFETKTNWQFEQNHSRGWNILSSEGNFDYLNRLHFLRQKERTYSLASGHLFSFVQNVTSVGSTEPPSPLAPAPPRAQNTRALARRTSSGWRLRRIGACPTASCPTAPWTGWWPGLPGPQTRLQSGDNQLIWKSQVNVFKLEGLFILGFEAETLSLEIQWNYQSMCEMKWIHYFVCRGILSIKLEKTFSEIS